MADSPGLCYTARCPHCLRIVAACTDNLPRKDLARATGQWIRDGLQLERMAVEQVRVADWGHGPDCPHYRPPRHSRSAPTLMGF
jgi:hypothetical protein